MTRIIALQARAHCVKMDIILKHFNVLNAQNPVFSVLQAITATNVSLGDSVLFANITVRQVARIQSVVKSLAFALKVAGPVLLWLEGSVKIVLNIVSAARLMMFVQIVRSATGVEHVSTTA